LTPEEMTMREKLQDSLAYPPRLMDLDRSAAYVGFGRTKFMELVAQGKMPQPIDVDGNPRWDRHELDAAVDDLKDRRRDPVKRSRSNLEDRLAEQEGRV
jgi:predicted DNA-binding transcriptional regulator AlpA